MICPECRKEVSFSAAFCPHCGFPLSGRSKEIQPAISPVLPPIATTATAPDFESQLRKLARLKEEGLISEDEFNRKKRVLLLSTSPDNEQALVGTAAAPGQQLSKDQPWLTWLGIGVLLLFMIGWIADGAGCSPTTTSNSMQESGPKLISKSQWREKVRPYWNPGGSVKVTTIANFKALVGEPSQTQTVEGHAYWYYECSDGTIQVDLVDPNMSGGRMLLNAINDF
jgi:hypothetical protein